jgi:hypothetical protein
MRWKLSEAFLRVVEAFSTLSRPARKIKYDGSINSGPAPLQGSSAGGASLVAAAEGIRSPEGAMTYKKTPIKVGSVFGNAEFPAPRVQDRRRADRLLVELPVRVTPAIGGWQEVTTSHDVSRFGIRFRLTKSVEIGSAVRIEIPMPKHLRFHSHSEPLYFVTATVRHAHQLPGEPSLIGAEFMVEIPLETTEAESYL